MLFNIYNLGGTFLEHDAFEITKFIRTSLKSNYIDTYKKSNEQAPLKKISYYDELKHPRTCRALRLDFQDDNTFLVLVIKQQQ